MNHQKEGKRIGCLLVHGFGGSPFEMEYLGEKLEQSGLQARRICLPGHAANIEDFGGTRFSHWAEAVERSYVELEKEVDKVVVIGISMGGSLGLYLGQRHRPAAIITLASPVFLFQLFPWKGMDWRLPIVGLLKKIKPFVEVDVPSKESDDIAPTRGYEGVIAMYPLHSFLQGLREVRRNLEKVTSPVLVVHSPKDAISPVENAWEILRSVSSDVRRLELLPIKEQVTSHHVLTTHRETKEKVAALCLEFIRRNTATVDSGELKD